MQATLHTYFLCEVVPLEFAEVLEAPEVIVVGRAALAAHGLPVQHLSHSLGHPLVIKFHPALCEVLPAVLALLLTPLPCRCICSVSTKDPSKVELPKCQVCVSIASRAAQGYCCVGTKMRSHAVSSNEQNRTLRSQVESVHFAILRQHVPQLLRLLRRRPLSEIDRQRHQAQGGNLAGLSHRILAQRNLTR